jgi:hypothetical protein
MGAGEREEASAGNRDGWVLKISRDERRRWGVRSARESADGGEVEQVPRMGRYGCHG